jgi:hypothetical protein
MQPQMIDTRVERLEVRMNALEQLPARVDKLTEDIASLGSQLSQFREEMREGFSAISREIRAGDESTRTDLREEIRAASESTRANLREEVRAASESTSISLREEIRAGDEETRRTLGQRIDETRRELTGQIDEKFEEAKNFARALHEDLIDRIKTIGEGKRKRGR